MLQRESDTDEFTQFKKLGYDKSTPQIFEPQAPDICGVLFFVFLTERIIDFIRISQNTCLLL